MSSKRTIGHDAITSRFISVKVAKRRLKTTTVETYLSVGKIRAGGKPSDSIMIEPEAAGGIRLGSRPFGSIFTPMPTVLFSIGFLEIDIWDLFDIFIVGVLLYQLYRLLKGSIALNIFVGMMLLFLSYQAFKALGMDLLSSILFQFINIGFVSLIIIFQPEVRRFLLLLGTNTLKQRDSAWSRLLGREVVDAEGGLPEQEDVRRAFLRMAGSRTGALIVCAQEADPETIISGGTSLNADISYGLVVSIFHKESPLHDGAVVVQNRRITRASAILPISESMDLPRSVGLRHRAAVGVTEKIDAVCFLVSEESGKISFAKEGALERGITEERLVELLGEYL